MDGTAFLARVEDYHKGGWRLALINVTTVLPVAAAHGAASAPAAGAAQAAGSAQAARAAPASATAAPAAGASQAAAEASPAPATTPGDAPAATETPGLFEMAWAFARDCEFETIREQIAAGDTVPSISEFFGAAFLYENEIRELFGINVTGIGLDLQGQLYKTATKVPFSHAAVKARLEATTAAAAAAAATTEKKA